jgi:hypothetical protein
MLRNSQRTCAGACPIIHAAGATHPTSTPRTTRHARAPQSLLCDPNPNSPANSEAARLYSENRREYNRRVREVVENSWIEDDAAPGDGGDGDAGAA